MTSAATDALSLARLFDLALDLLCVAGTDGYFRRVNRAFTHTLGWSEEELLAAPFLDFVHPDDVDATLVAVATLAAGETVVDFENRYRTRGGGYRWLAWRSMPSEDGRLIYACARDVTDEKRALGVARERAAIIERQSRDLERASRVHRTLTQAVADGAGTADVMRAVATLTGKPTMLLSPSSAVLHAVAPDSIALPGEWPPASAGAAVRRVLQGLDAQPSAVLPPLPELGLPTRHVVSRLAASGELLGWLVVAEVGTPIASFDAQVVEHAATVLTLEVVSRHRRQQAERLAREDVLADLLHGDRDPAQLRARARTCGIDLGRPHVVVRVGYDPGTPPPISGPARREHLARHVADRLGDGPVLAVGVPGADVLLCPLAPGPGREALERVRAEVAAALVDAGLRRSVRGAVVSRCCTQPAHFAEGHRELRSVLDALGSVGSPDGVVLTGGVGVLRVVLATAEVGSARRFAEDLLAPLLDHDRRGGGDLLGTLRAFLAAGGRVRPAAQALGVHENTVRYRLGRIRQLAGIDVDDLGSLLDARFALEALALTSGLPASPLEEPPKQPAEALPPEGPAP